MRISLSNNIYIYIYIQFEEADIKSKAIGGPGHLIHSFGDPPRRRSVLAPGRRQGSRSQADALARMIRKHSVSRLEGPSNDSASGRERLVDGVLQQGQHAHLSCRGHPPRGLVGGRSSWYHGRCRSMCTPMRARRISTGTLHFSPWQKQVRRHPRIHLPRLSSPRSPSVSGWVPRPLRGLTG